MSFDFVPRSVKKRKTYTSAATTTSPTEKHARESLAHNEKLSSTALVKNAISSAANQTISAPKTPASSSHKDPDPRLLADLICLALSNYALWAEVDLRRKIEWNAQSYNDAEDDEVETRVNDFAGFIPLAYLFRKSPVFVQALSSSSFQYPETLYVKALRTHATEFVDVRLVLSSETSSSRNPTGYEVRRRLAADAISNQYSKPYWDRLTIYVENIPVHCRHLPGTLKFIMDLLKPSPSYDPARVQNIAYPCHYRDQPNDIPVCKGFALVTLKTQEDMDYILEKWPWNVHPVDPTSKLEHGQSAAQEAAKFGFRSITKEHWESLKAEYLLFRQELVREINRSQETRHEPINYPQAATHTTKNNTDGRPKKLIHASTSKHAGDGKEMTHVPTLSAGKIHENSPYPSGCLVFVRHLHPETNKTTLRALFMQAWSADNGGVSSSSLQPDTAIDYLDYMKSMDSCYIRFRTPSHAEQFVNYFSGCKKRQTSGLDSVGSALAFGDAAIAAELVLGKREEVYWQKVPEKVKRQAVDKVLNLLEIQQGREPEAGGDRRKRKR